MLEFVKYKFTLQGSTNENYKKCSVFPIMYSYKKSIMYLVKKFKLDKYHKDVSNKREFIYYDLLINYASKSFD